VGQREVVYKLENVNKPTDMMLDSINEHRESVETNNTQSAKLSEIFRTMNRLVEEKLITDFSVTRSSLEQVFIHFAKFQRQEQQLHQN